MKTYFTACLLNANFEVVCEMKKVFLDEKKCAMEILKFFLDSDGSIDVTEHVERAIIKNINTFEDVQILLDELYKNNKYVVKTRELSCDDTDVFSYEDILKIVNN